MKGHGGQIRALQKYKKCKNTKGQQKNYFEESGFSGKIAVLCCKAGIGVAWLCGRDKMKTST